MKPTRIALAALVCFGPVLARSTHAPFQQAVTTAEGALSCAERSVTAAGVRTQQDLQAFVQCAYEYVQEEGVTEARRAFHEDARWRSGMVFVFVDEGAPAAGSARSLVFPPDATREGVSWGRRIDAFGSDIADEISRVAGSRGEGWIYYALTDPATAMAEPRIAYVKEIDWAGTPATIGAGICRRDLPATCRQSEANATNLTDSPSPESLQEFVRCAVMELESNGYFALASLSTDPRWQHGPDLRVRPRQLRTNTVQRQPLRFAFARRRSRVERSGERALRRARRGERGQCVRRVLPVLRQSQPDHRNAGEEGGVR